MTNFPMFGLFGKLHCLPIKTCFTKPHVLILWFCLLVCFSKHKDHLVEIVLREMGHIWNEPHLSFGENKVSSSGLKPISWRLGLDSLTCLLQGEWIYLSVSLCVGLGMTPSWSSPYLPHFPHLWIWVYLSISRGLLWCIWKQSILKKEARGLL